MENFIFCVMIQTIYRLIGCTIGYTPSSPTISAPLFLQLASLKTLFIHYQWNKLYSNIRSSSYKLFRKRILEFVRPRPNFILMSLTLLLTDLTRLRIGLSHLREYKFRHYFWDSLNPIYNCSNAIKSTKRCLLLEFQEWKAAPPAKCQGLF